MATILILDDYKSLNEAVSDWMKVYGHDPKSFGSAQKALEFLSEGGSAEVFVVDLMLQAGESGEDFITVLMERFGVPGTRIVVFTGHASKYPALPTLSAQGVRVVHQTRGWTQRLLNAVEHALAIHHA